MRRIPEYVRCCQAAPFFWTTNALKPATAMSSSKFGILRRREDMFATLSRGCKVWLCWWVSIYFFFCSDNVWIVRDEESQGMLYRRSVGLLCYWVAPSAILNITSMLHPFAASAPIEEGRRHRPRMLATIPSKPLWCSIHPVLFESWEWICGVCKVSQVYNG